MHDVIEQRRESIESYIEALPYPSKARGVIVAIDGQFVATDLFDKAPTLERLWKRLVTGYAVDAIWRPKGKTKAFSRKAAQVLLDHVGEIECQPCPTVGLGEDWRFEVEDVVGQALIAGETSVHLSVFPNVDGQRHDEADRRIVPPSRRRRGRGSPPGDIVY